MFRKLLTVASLLVDLVLTEGGGVVATPVVAGAVVVGAVVRAVVDVPVVPVGVVAGVVGVVARLEVVVVGACGVAVFGPVGICIPSAGDY
jgi:hypothetical protein